MANRLLNERSPYLLQHAHNPVDWYPWCPEAFARARELGRPIFLSIGYAACHWCHVMERESFEDPQIAEILNQHFVSIKVDREERPDIDQIYMQAVMAMRGQGGWPLSAFLTPAQEIFFGGTYWPPTDRYGLPGFGTVLRRIAAAYRDQPAEIAAQAQQLTEFLAAGSFPNEASHPPLDRSGLLRIARELEARVDWQHGGFDSAPKFPHAMDLEFLLRMATAPEAAAAHPPLRSEQAVRLSLERMAAGGIYDQVGGGFARYSVDAHWLVPHFEKMLYDNGLLARLYLDAFRAWGDPRHAEIARETLQYLLRDMRDPAGAFHSSEDADSEGVEGKFYVWSADELAAVLGPDFPRFRDVYGVTAGGNFEGANILHLPQSLTVWAAAWDIPLPTLAKQLQGLRDRLQHVRAERVRPAKDDKVLTSWNGLAIDALAVAAVSLPEDDPDQALFLQAAQTAARFFLTVMRAPDGTLFHAYRQGTPYQMAFVDDYAGLINALLSLFAADGDWNWVAAAEPLAERMVADFADAEHGGFFYTGVHHDRLIARPKECQDNSLPSGNSAAATALARLGHLLQEQRWMLAAQGAIRAAQPLLARAPAAAAQVLNAADLATGPQHLVVVAAVAEDFAWLQAEVRRIQRGWHPAWQFIVVPPTTARPPVLEKLLRDKGVRQGESALYHCQQFACAAPRVGRAAIEAFLGELDPRR